MYLHYALYLVVPSLMSLFEPSSVFQKLMNKYKNWGGKIVCTPAVSFPQVFIVYSYARSEHRRLDDVFLSHCLQPSNAMRAAGGQYSMQWGLEKAPLDPSVLTLGEYRKGSQGRSLRLGLVKEE